MTNSLNRRALTLVEVLIAIAILGIGIAAAAALQSGALQYSVVAREITQATRLAQNEVAWQRETAIEIGNTACKTTEDPVDPTLQVLPAGFTSCTVDIEPCTLASKAITCGSSVVPAAYRVTVTIAGDGARDFSHSTLYTGIYVSGTAGEQGGGGE